MSHFDPLSSLQGLPEIHPVKKLKSTSGGGFSEIFNTVRQETENHQNAYPARESTRSRIRPSTRSVLDRARNPREAAENSGIRTPSRKEGNQLGPRGANLPTEAAPEGYAARTEQSLPEGKMKIEENVDRSIGAVEEARESLANTGELEPVQEADSVLVLAGQTLPAPEVVNPLGKMNTGGLEIPLPLIFNLLELLSINPNPARNEDSLEIETATTDSPLAGVPLQAGISSVSTASDLLSQLSAWLRSTCSSIQTISEKNIQQITDQPLAENQWLIALAETLFPEGKIPADIVSRLSSMGPQPQLTSDRIMNLDALSRLIQKGSGNIPMNPTLSSVEDLKVTGSAPVFPGLPSTSGLESEVPGSSKGAAKELRMGILSAQQLKGKIIPPQQFETPRGDEAKGQIANLSAPPTDLPGSVQGRQNPSIGVQEGEHEKTQISQVNELARTAARKETAAINVSKEVAELEVPVENESFSTSPHGKNSELFKVALSPATEGPQPPAQTKIPLQPSVPVGHGYKGPDSLTAQVAGNRAEGTSTSQIPWLAMDKATVVSQLIDKARLLAGKHAGELVITLKPEFLGRLCLQAAMVENELVATITAESHQVKQMLESHLPALQSSLQEQGLQVSKIMVVQGNDINFADFQERQSDHRQNPRAGELTHTMGAEKLAQGEEVSDFSLLGKIPSSSSSHGINLLA